VRHRQHHRQVQLLLVAPGALRPLVEKIDRTYERIRGVVGGEDAQGKLGSVPVIRDRARGVAGGRPVPGERDDPLGRLRVPFQRLAVQVLEGLRDTPVQPHAARRRKAVVERVANEDVREAEPVGRPRDIGHDPRRDGFVETVQQLVDPHTVQPRDRVDGELSAED
jgi:hypothetical protein